MNILAVDSDTKTVGLAYLQDGKLSSCMILENPEAGMVLEDNFPEMYPDYIVMEVPEVTLTWTRRGVDANNLLTLSRAAGITATLLSYWTDCDKIKYITPKEWKGQASKKSNQSRTALHYGFEYVSLQKSIKITNSPVEATRWPSRDPVKDSDWTHMMDAVGIAHWASSKLKRLEYMKGFRT